VPSSRIPQRGRARSSPDLILSETIIYRLEKAAGWDFGEDLIIDSDEGRVVKVLDVMPDWYWSLHG